MPTIREALLPYMDSEGLPIDAYEAIMVKLTNMVTKWQTNIAPALTVEGDGGTLLSMVFATELKGAIVE